ncbi:MAG: hypothetical protein AAGH89_08595 [Verrucomicrobiota bacterium]
MDFPDAPANDDFKKKYDRLLKEESIHKSGIAETVPSYFNLISDGKFKVTFDTTSIIRAENPYRHYWKSRKEGAKKGKMVSTGRHELLVEALEKLEASGFDFGPYFSDPPHTKEMVWPLLLVQHHHDEDPRGLGVSGTTLRWGLGKVYRLTGGGRVDRFCGGHTKRHLFHEGAHLILNWPDQYAVRSNLGEATGVISLMCGHRSNAPDPYSLYVSGWLDVENLFGQEGEFSIDATEFRKAYIYYDPDNPEEFFFINAVSNGLPFESKYPEEGLAIWRVYRKGENARYPDHPLEVELIHSGGDNRDFSKGAVFFRPEGCNEFSSDTTPDSRWRFGRLEGTNSGLSLTVAGRKGSLYRFRLGR